MKQKIVIYFPENLVEEPILHKLIKEYDLIFNILKAKIKPDEKGVAVIELSGEESNYNKALKYLKGLGLKIEPLSKEIILDKDKCTECTACISHCPTQALYVENKETMKFKFDKDKCIACEACIPVCPVRALSLNF